MARGRPRASAAASRGRKRKQVDEADAPVENEEEDTVQVEADNTGDSSGSSGSSSSSSDEENGKDDDADQKADQTHPRAPETGATIATIATAHGFVVQAEQLHHACLGSRTLGITDMVKRLKHDVKVQPKRPSAPRSTLIQPAEVHSSLSRADHLRWGMVAPLLESTSPSFNPSVVSSSDLAWYEKTSPVVFAEQKAYLESQLLQYKRNAKFALVRPEIAVHVEQYLLQKLAFIRQHFPRMYEAVGSFLFNQASDPLPPIGESGNKVIEFVACLSQTPAIAIVNSLKTDEVINVDLPVGIPGDALPLAQDPTALDLQTQHSVDVVASMGALDALARFFADSNSAWALPVTVSTHIASGKKVVYLDNAIPASSMGCRDYNWIYYGNALKRIAAPVDPTVPAAAALKAGIFYNLVKIGQHTVLVRDRADAVNQQENNRPWEVLTKLQYSGKSKNETITTGEYASLSIRSKVSPNVGLAMAFVDVSTTSVNEFSKFNTESFASAEIKFRALQQATLLDRLFQQVAALEESQYVLVSSHNADSIGIQRSVDQSDSAMVTTGMFDLHNCIDPKLMPRQELDVYVPPVWTERGGHIPNTFPLPPETVSSSSGSSITIPKKNRPGNEKAKKKKGKKKP